jgi:hypothetical protein
MLIDFSLVNLISSDLKGPCHKPQLVFFWGIVCPTPNLTLGLFLYYQTNFLGIFWAIFGAKGSGTKHASILGGGKHYLFRLLCWGEWPILQNILMMGQSNGSFWGKKWNEIKLWMHSLINVIDYFAQHPCLTFKIKKYCKKKTLKILIF